MLEFTYVDNLFLVIAELYLSYRIIRYGTTKGINSFKIGISLLSQELIFISYLLRCFYYEFSKDNIFRWNYFIVLVTIIFNIFLLRMPFRKVYI